VKDRLATETAHTHLNAKKNPERGFTRVALALHRNTNTAMPQHLVRVLSR
jgi:hypothetical protein